MLEILINVLVMAGIFCTLLGLVTVLQWFKTPKMPADSSNRINNISSWWIGLTRPEVLAASYKYYKQDVMKNMEDINEPQKS